MRLTPLDIRKQEFTRGLRGFDSEEVLAFLQMLSSQWEDLLDESRRKDDKIRELETKMAHYQKVEEALQDALQTARETSKNALQNAEDKARLIVDGAENRAEEIKRVAERDRHEIKRETAKLSGRRTEIVTRLRAFLMSELELLARFEGDDPVGFIKLLPAERQRVRRAGDERPPSDEDVRESGGVRRKETPYEPDEDRPSAHHASADTDEPADASRDSPSSTEDEGEDSEIRQKQDFGDTWTANEDEGIAGSQEKDVVTGPGWTNRTVVSQPAEHSAPQEEEEGDVDDADADETGTRASSDEIEKIRRILSDLD